jgi:hypothetical protein
MSLWLTEAQTRDQIIGKRKVLLTRLDELPRKLECFGWMRSKSVTLWVVGAGNGWMSLTSPHRCGAAINFCPTGDPNIWTTDTGVRYAVKTLEAATGEERQIRFDIKRSH